jgi:hypothetical protein
MPTKPMMRQFELTCRTAGAPEHGSSRACLARAKRPGSKSSRSNCGWKNRFRDALRSRTRHPIRIVHTTSIGISQTSAIRAPEHGELLKLREAIQPKCTRQAVFAC